MICKALELICCTVNLKNILKSASVDKEDQPKVGRSAKSHLEKFDLDQDKVLSW